MLVQWMVHKTTAKCICAHSAKISMRPDSIVFEGKEVECYYLLLAKVAPLEHGTRHSKKGILHILRCVYKTTIEFGFSVGKTPANRLKSQDGICASKIC